MTILIAALSISACTEREHPKDLLPEAEYEKMLLELRMIGQYAEATGDTLNAARLADSLLLAEGISAERFQVSHAWYEQDVAAQKARFQRLADSLSALDVRISTLDNP